MHIDYPRSPPSIQPRISLNGSIFPTGFFRHTCSSSLSAYSIGLWWSLSLDVCIRCLDLRVTCVFLELIGWWSLKIDVVGWVGGLMSGTSPIILHNECMSLCRIHVYLWEVLGFTCLARMDVTEFRFLVGVIIDSDILLLISLVVFECHSRGNSSWRWWSIAIRSILNELTKLEFECLSQAVKHIRLTAADMDLIPVINHCTVKSDDVFHRFYAIFFLKPVFRCCTKTLGIFDTTAQLFIHEAVLSSIFLFAIYTRKWQGFLLDRWHGNRSNILTTSRRLYPVTWSWSSVDSS